ncbi:MAG: hypothetical protein BWX88_02176 [Planctomycetes bacterium ADurb.Bin126]|nr:MAG: hypothetical protein BWX88_02176 [Planctomycetes bacterium ADurb.Bin126]HOD79770.1 hypothetical protein [Phycisphaerae bacterium]HQL76468.1 hypothetical protein [Phycisphaerae bacterium]
MGKRKNSIALYEVITKNKKPGAEPKLTVPSWAGHDATAAVGPADRPVQEDLPAAAGSEGSAASPPSIFDAPAPREPALVREGNRVRLTLSPLNWALLGLGLVVLLAVAFLVGRSSVTVQQNLAALPGAPGPVSQGPVVQGGAGVDQGQVPAAVPSRRIAGKYYLVIQGGLKDKEEGDRIAQFCYENGEPSTVSRYSQSNQYFVLSMAPQDAPDSAAAIRHAQKIEELGKKYFQKHRTYDFRQRNRENKFQPTFLLHREND